MSNTKLYKLISGEELIATYVDSGLAHCEVTDAVTIIYQQNKDGMTTAGFAPYMPYSEGNITLYDTAIASSSDVTEQLLQEYNRVFSKIVLAPGAGKIIGAK